MVDKKNDENKEENIIKRIEEVSKEIPNLKIPSMGIINNESKINIDGSKYIKSSVKED